MADRAFRNFLSPVRYSWQGWPSSHQSASLTVGNTAAPSANLTPLYFFSIGSRVLFITNSQLHIHALLSELEMPRFGVPGLRCPEATGAVWSAKATFEPPAVGFKRNHSSMLLLKSWPQLLPCQRISLLCMWCSVYIRVSLCQGWRWKYWSGKAFLWMYP